MEGTLKQKKTFREYCLPKKNGQHVVTRLSILARIGSLPIS